MTTDNTRHIVVKTLLNADEFQQFERQCKANDVPQSRAIRDLVKSWLHLNEPVARRERPKTVHNLARSLPGRRVGAPVPLRL